MQAVNWYPNLHSLQDTIHRGSILIIHGGVGDGFWLELGCVWKMLWKPFLDLAFVFDSLFRKPLSMALEKNLHGVGFSERRQTLISHRRSLRNLLLRGSTRGDWFSFVKPLFTFSSGPWDYFWLTWMVCSRHENACPDDGDAVVLVIVMIQIFPRI